MLCVTWYEDRYVLSFLELHKVSLSLSVVVTSSCKCPFFEPLPRVFPLNGDIFSRRPSGQKPYRLLSVSPQGDGAIYFSRAFFGSRAWGCRTGDTQRDESSVNWLSLSKSRERKWKKWPHLSHFNRFSSGHKSLCRFSHLSHLQLTWPKVTHLKKHGAFVRPSFRSSQIRKTICFLPVCLTRLSFAWSETRRVWLHGSQTGVLSVS